jgi:hypothetical protein
MHRGRDDSVAKCEKERQEEADSLTEPERVSGSVVIETIEANYNRRTWPGLILSDR